MEDNKIKDLVAYLNDKHEEDGVVIASGLDVLVEGLEEAYISIRGDLDVAREKNDFDVVDKLARLLDTIDEVSEYFKLYSDDLLKNIEEK